MNKKGIIASILAILLCFCLSACSSNIDVESTTTTTEIISTTLEETTVVEEVTEAEAKTTTEATTKEETTTEATTKKETTTKKVTTTKKQKATTKSSQNNIQTVKCTVTVDCKSILDNIDDLKEGHQPFVPASGYIINNYTYFGTEESSVFDALKQACTDNNIRLTAEKTSYGIYVSGINNLDEFDCGKQSGWMYSVNGQMPNTTCENVKIHNGDNITFKYVCKYQ